jgi:hypothetical protein
MTLAAHTRMEGEAIGLGHPLQFGIRFVRGRMVRIMKAMRRAPQLGKNPRLLQENATARLTERRRGEPKA